MSSLDDQLLDAGDVASAQRLLIAGADPEASAGDDYTAFMLAASAGDVAAVRLLRQHRADPARRQ